MRIAGVPARLHPTALVFMAVAAWSAYAEVGSAKVYDRSSWARALSGGGPWLMPSTAPGTGWAIAAAAGAALVVLGSILLSGLAHLVAVRRTGLRPTGMELFFLGGAVACAEDERPRERSALEAGSGPLATAALALAGWAALGGSFDVGTPHSESGLVGLVLLRTCALFNAFVLLASLVLLLVWLLHRARG